MASDGKSLGLQPFLEGIDFQMVFFQASKKKLTESQNVAEENHELFCLTCFLFQMFVLLIRKSKMIAAMNWTAANPIDIQCHLLRFGNYLDPKKIPSKHRSPQEVFAWMSTGKYHLPWEPTFPSFLGVISPIYWGFKILKPACFMGCWGSRVLCCWFFLDSLVTLHPPK